MFCFKFQFLTLIILLLTIGVLVVSGDDKLRVLIIAPSTKMMETHFQVHRQLANFLAHDSEVGKMVEYVYLLGLVEYAGEEMSDPESPREQAKLIVWKRKRDGLAGVDANLRGDFSSKPLENMWRYEKPFMPPANEGAKTHYLDIVLKNEKLMKKLRNLDFNVGIMESIGLDGLQHGIFHFLPSIKVTVVSSSVPPTMPHWDLMGYEEIVDKIPGLNMAHVGIHEDVIKGNFNAIKANNKLWIERKEAVGIKTHAKWLELLKHSQDDDIRASAPSLPGMEQLFSKASFFLVNHQPMVDYELVEREVAKPNEITPQLRFFGGIGMLGQDGRLKVPEELHPKTQAVFDKNRKVVMVSFGTLVELGNDPDLSTITKEEEKIKAQQMIEDNNEKTEEFLHEFSKFPHVDFIFKYGPKLAAGANVDYKHLKDKNANFIKNVHAKGWLEQKAILARGPAAFISHCGQNSVMEALAFRVPLICMPFFGDQLNNAEALASRGLAVVIDMRKKESFSKSLNAALSKLLTIKREPYKMRMAYAQRKFINSKPIEVLRQTFNQILREVKVRS